VVSVPLRVILKIVLLPWAPHTSMIPYKFPSVAWIGPAIR
jgi:hypothetical protein